MLSDNYLLWKLNVERISVGSNLEHDIVQLSSIKVKMNTRACVSMYNLLIELCMLIYVLFVRLQQMLNYLKEKKDAGFFTSIAGLMNSCRYN